MLQNTKKPWHRMHIYDLPQPLDFYRDSSLALHEWMKRGEDGEAYEKERIAMQAVMEVLERNLHVPGESPDIRVAYNFTTDGPFFIFRYRSNGRSLIVSQVNLMSANGW